MWNQDLKFGKKTSQEHNQDIQLKVTHIHYQLVRKKKKSGEEMSSRPPQVKGEDLNKRRHLTNSCMIILLLKV